MDMDTFTAVALRHGDGAVIVIIRISHTGPIRESLFYGPVLPVKGILHCHDPPGVHHTLQLPLRGIGVTEAVPGRHGSCFQAASFHFILHRPAGMVGDRIQESLFAIG